MTIDYDTFLANRFRIIDAMRSNGGNFARCFADALAAADPQHRSRLFTAEAELIAEYGPGSCAFEKTPA